MKNSPILLSFFVLSIFFLASCKLAESISPNDQVDDDAPAYGFGWIGNEDLGKVPENVKFGFASNSNLPTSFDLSDLLPPVASQGSYGTCISWAAGYYGKTATEALTFGYKATDLAKTTNQIIPYLKLPIYPVGHAVRLDLMLVRNSTLIV